MYILCISGRRDPGQLPALRQGEEYTVIGNKDGISVYSLEQIGGRRGNYLLGTVDGLLHHVLGVGPAADVVPGVVVGILEVIAHQEAFAAAHLLGVHDQGAAGEVFGQDARIEVDHGRKRVAGLLEDAVLSQADPYLCLVKARYGRAPAPAMTRAGSLCPEWAERLGLPAGIAVSGSSFDAHAGAVGAGIRPGTMVCTIGTSAVDMVVAKAENLSGDALRRFGGKAEDSILPGYIGIETGQAAFGDIFAWYKRLLLWPVRQALSALPPEQGEAVAAEVDANLLRLLEAEAQTRTAADFPVALDWFNGRRYPDTDDLQSAAISGLTLGTDAVEVYRAIVFGAVCGLRRIVSGFLDARVIETFDPNEARREAYEAPYQAYLRLAAFQEHASSHQGCGTSAEKKDSL